MSGTSKMSKLFLGVALGIVAGVIFVQLISRIRPGFGKMITHRIIDKAESSKRAFLEGYTTGLSSEKEYREY